MSKCPQTQILCKSKLRWYSILVQRIFIQNTIGTKPFSNRIKNFIYLLYDYTDVYVTFYPSKKSKKLSCEIIFCMRITYNITIELLAQMCNVKVQLPK